MKDNQQNKSDIEPEINIDKDLNFESEADINSGTTSSIKISEPPELEKSKSSKKRTSGLSVASLLFAIILPPVGLIMSMIAKAKARNSNSSTTVANVALTISTILFIGLISAGGVIIYQNYNRTLDSQDSAKNIQQNEKTTPSNYSDDQKKAIEISETFLNDIKTENYSAAFNLLSSDLQKEYINGESDFSKEVTTANLKLIDSWKVTEVTSNGKGDRITIKGTANFRGPTPSGNFEFAFYKDTDGSKKMYLWQISPNT